MDDTLRRLRQEARPGAEEALVSDLQALSEVTARSVPDLAPRLASLTAARLPARGRRFPRLAVALAAALFAALLVVPLPYPRTVGYTVALTLDAPGLAQERASRIGAELKSALGGEDVSFADPLAPLLPPEAPGRYTLLVTVPSSYPEEIERVARAFALTLASQGIKASTTVEPRTIRDWGSVYAMTLQKLRLWIAVEGRSEAEIEASIRAQLSAAGLDHSIEVKKSGDQSTTVIELSDLPPDTDIDVRVEGEEGGAGYEKHILRRPLGLSDEEYRTLLEQALRDLGADVQVTIEGGQPDITPRTSESPSKP